MKKQVKTTVMAIALLATVTGAFASDIAKIVIGKQLAAYTWDTFDQSGNPTGSNIPGDENSFSECPTSPTDDLCAVGRLVSNPSVVIERYYQ